MKIIAEVEIANRLLPSLNISGKGRSQRSSLAICKQPGTENELFILHQTLINKLGTKYKVKKNIENVFTRFVNEGKTTLRFKAPPIDMFIKCDPVQLKSFLQVLKLSLNPKVPVKTLNLSSLSTTSQAALKAKTKLQVSKREDYPYTAGFPRTLEILKIIDIGQTVFDKRILQLKNLKKLDLSNNLLTSLPEALGSLPCLNELNLECNRLGEIKPNDTGWSWIGGKNLAASLKYLNLSNNQIYMLPLQISRLHSIITLKLDHNNIQQLPQGIGNLRQLRYFSVSKNQLHYLPGCMKELKLLYMDVSQNCFSNLNPAQNSIVGHFDIPCLLEIAAKTIITKRIRYSAEIIPWTLVHYLDNAHYCMCGKPCFETHIRKYIHTQLCQLCPEVVVGEAETSVWFDAFFCSQKCVLYYNKDY